MRKIREVVILSDVTHDLNNGKEFYNRSEPGVGDYFWDSLIADMKSLIIYGGVHIVKNGYYRMSAKRFPYSIYYTIEKQVAYVIAVLPMRKDPLWIEDQLGVRE